jgi:hypothetical protein
VIATLNAFAYLNVIVKSVSVRNALENMYLITQIHGKDKRTPQKKSFRYT